MPQQEAQRMTPRIAAALAALAIALIFAACGGDGGIAVVPDEERQEREDILDRERDGDAGLGDENSSDARDDALDQELDGDARRFGDDADEGQPETFSIAGAETSIDVRDLPCSSEDAFVRTSDGSIGCVAATDIADFVSCGEESRPVLDLVNLLGDADATPLTMCVPRDEAPDEVFDEVEIDD